MRFTMNESHLQRGRRGLCTVCPVALVIAEALPGSDPWVYPDRVELTRFGCTVSVPTNEAIERFVVRFDAGMRLKPIEFDLPIPAA